MFRGKIAKAIIKHNYSYSFVEHEASRELLRYLNPDVKHVLRNIARSKVKVYEKDRKNLK